MLRAAVVTELTVMSSLIKVKIWSVTASAKRFNSTNCDIIWLYTEISFAELTRSVVKCNKGEIGTDESWELPQQGIILCI